MTTMSVEVKNPYPGLRPYEPHEFEQFFGRDRQVDELLLRLRDHRLVAVVGLSGSGKSSLIRAGLMHKLEVGHLTSAGSEWKIALFRPGSKPIDALSAALDEALGEQPGRADALSKSTQELLWSTRAGRQPHQNLLIVVDQFEEIFRFQREQFLSARDAAHFVDLLLAVEQDLSPDYRLFVVLTMRTDYLGDCAQFEGLPETLNRCQYLVPRMSRDQMREAIEGPAALTETEINPDLLQMLLAEAAEGRDQLPLLQHLLMLLWEKREPPPGGGWKITSRQHEALGGPAKALNDHADSVLKSLGSPERSDLARKIFQRLTELGEGRDQRRPARLSQLVEVINAPLVEVKAVVNKFFEASFLTSPDRDRTEDWEVDITHESLIRQWTKLKEWAEAEAAIGKDYEEYARRAARTDGERGLLTDVDLDLALKWLEKKYNEAWASRYEGNFVQTVAFIERSREAAAQARKNKAAQRRKEQTRRWVSWLALAFLIVALAVGGLGLYAWRLREYDTALAQRAMAFSLAERAARARDEANAAAKEAEKGKNNAINQRDQAEAERKQTEHQRTIAIWKGLISEAGQHLTDGKEELSALFARQALVLHGSTPEQPKRLIEEMLLRVSELPYLSYKLGESDGAVASVAFSPDGTRIASGGGDKTVRLWDVRQPSAPALVFQGNDGAVSSVAFSPDGTRLAAGSDDHTIRLWDLRRPSAPALVLAGHEQSISSVAFSPDGTRLASGSFDKTIRLWDLRRPSAPALVLRAIESPLTVYVTSVAFSPDGTRLAAGNGSLSPDGKRLAAVNGSFTILLWDLRQPSAPAMVLAGHEQSISSVAFSPDGTRLASGSNDNTVRLWDLRHLSAPALVLKGHESYVSSVAFSPDGTRLASGSGDNTIRLWDLRGPGVPGLGLALKGHEGSVSSMAFSPDGTRLASGSRDKTIRLWGLRQSNAPALVLKGHEDAVYSVAFPSDGSRLASGGGDKTVRLWDLRQSGASTLALKGHTESVFSVAFSPDGTRLASGSFDKTVRLWNLRQGGAPALVLKGHESYVSSVAFSPDGTRLASGSDDNTIRLWDLRQPGAPALVLKGHESSVASVAFSPDGTRLASGSYDKTIRLWDLRQPSALALVLKGHEDQVCSVAFSPDGTRLVSGSKDNTVRLWDLLQPSAQAVVFKGHESSVFSVAFSPDGTRLASGSDDNTVRLWDLRQPRAPALIIKGHESYVLAVAFSPDGTRLASGSADNTIRVWDLWNRSADHLCTMVGHNLSMDEWRLYVGEGIPYQRTCPNLPPGVGAPGAK